MTALAVMQDDTVLCTDCVQEYRHERLPETPATIVYAWLAEPAGETCRRCGNTDTDESRA